MATIKLTSTGRTINLPDDEEQKKISGKQVLTSTGRVIDTTPVTRINTKDFSTMQERVPQLPKVTAGVPQQKDTTLARAQLALAKTKAPQMGIGFGPTLPQNNTPIKKPVDSLPDISRKTLEKAKQLQDKNSGAMYQATAIKSGISQAIEDVKDAARAKIIEDTIKRENNQKGEFVKAFEGVSADKGFRDNLAQMAANLSTNIWALQDRMPGTQLWRWVIDNYMLTEEMAKKAGYTNEEELAQAMINKAMQSSKGHTEIQEELARRGEGRGKAAQAVATVGQGVGRLVPNIIAGTVMPGTGKLLLGGQSYGGGTMEALREGETLQDAQNRGTLRAGVEVGSEGIFDGIPGMGGMIKGGKVLGRVGEGLEETISTAMDAAIRRATGDENAQDATLEDYGRDFLTGVAVSEIFNLPGDVANIAGKIGRGEVYAPYRGENEAAARMAGQLDRMYGAEQQQGKALIDQENPTAKAEMPQTKAVRPQQETAPIETETAVRKQNAAESEDFENFWFGHSEVSEQEARELYNELKTKSNSERQMWLTWDWATKLKRKYGLGMETETLRTELDSIYKDADRNGWNENNTDRLRALARKLVDSEKGTVNQDRTQQIKDAKAYLRKITLPVTPAMKAEIESKYGNYEAFVKNHRNRLHLRKVDGKTNLQSVDAHYSQLSELAPEWFPEGIENASDFDIMDFVVNFVDNATEVRDYALNQDYNAAVSVLEESLRDGYYEIHRDLRASENFEEAVAAPTEEDRKASARNAPKDTAEDLNDPNSGVLTTKQGDLKAEAIEIDGRGGYTNLDLARVLDKVSKNNPRLRQKLFEAIERPLLKAKEKYAKAIVARLKEYKSAMDKLGIKAGSKESAAVQWIGEGQRQTEFIGQLEPYTLKMLQNDFPDTWENILKAEKIHRLIYDEYVERINKVLRVIYPNEEIKAEEELLVKKERLDAAQERRTEQQLLVQRLTQKAEMLNNQAQSDNLVEASKAKQELSKLTRQIAQENKTLIDRNLKVKEAAENYRDTKKSIEDGSYFTNRRLLPRKDYFHHFVEMEKANTLQGLVRIFNRPSDIATELVGVSDNTKPKTKWAGWLQRREGNVYTEDAIGGMARYIPMAEYKIHFDPYIAMLRGTAKSIVDGSKQIENVKLIDKDGRKPGANANGFIEYLTHFANDLAGKTNFVDRSAQIFAGDENRGGRQIMQALEWVNNRVKANAVVGNLGSAIVQIGNIPNAMTYVQNPVYWTKAAATMANQEKAEILLAQSPFLNERYLGKTIDIFDQKGALQKGAEWVLEIGDKKASELIWLAAYNQFEDQNGNVKGFRRYENAVDYADDVTRRSVAGRGVGEMPLTQRSRVVKLFAPFQVEVNNTYNLLREQIGAKNAKGLINYCAGAWLINSLIEAVANKSPLFDPIQALIEAIQALLGEEQDGSVQGVVKAIRGGEENKTNEKGSVGAAASRILGEAAGNLPYISTLAPMLADTVDMKKVFGEQDPTRYGTGMTATQEAFKQTANLLNGKPVDVLGLATTYVTPYGGQQLERFVKTGQNFGALPKLTKTEEGTQLKRQEVAGSYNDAGKLRFAMEPTAKNIVTTAAFGEYATPEGRAYLQGNTILSEDKTDIVGRAQSEAQIKPTLAESVIRGIDKQENTAAKRKYLYDSGLTPEQKAWMEHNLLATAAQKEKAEMALTRGIPLKTFYWIEANNGNGSNEATEAAINRTLGLNRMQKEWLWGVLTGGADKNNPYKK